MGDTVRLIFPATAEALNIAEDIFEVVARNVTPDLRKAYCIRTALSEAYSNAFLYGRNAGEDAEIEFGMCFKGDKFSATIINDGPGFAEYQIKSESFEAVMEESGRGLQIMKRFCDKLTFKRDDNDKFEVHMEFDLTTPAVKTHK